MGDFTATDYFYCGGAMIVRTWSRYDGIAYYMRGLPGNNPLLADIDYVASWGNSFPREVGDFMYLEGLFTPVPAQNPGDSAVNG